jgi:hypothetical protein
MTTVLRSTSELKKLLEIQMGERKRRTVDAVNKTASVAASMVRANAPVAFGELRHSVHAVSVRGVNAGSGTGHSSVTAKVVVDAPHAVDVEIGGRPRVVPLEDLVAWVKLRGLQYLADGPLTGSTSAAHAYAVGTKLGSMSRGGVTSVDAPTRIAMAIQRSIAKNGTPPQWFVRSTVPNTIPVLRAELHKAIYTK